MPHSGTSGRSRPMMKYFRSVNGIQIKTLQDEYGRFKVNNIGIYSDFAKP